MQAEGTEESHPDWQALERELTALSEKVEDLEVETLLGGEHDEQPAFVSIHAGAGGREAFDWADMLFRMYSMWAAARGFGLEITDETTGEGGGFQTVTFRVEGRHAYGLLKLESGIHRLVRISPYDANHRRHTTFASVDVIPEVTEDTTIDIKDDDIRIDTYRSSSAGGQHVNKTSSAIRITHIPTGIVVACQNERSQHQNREVAMRQLRSRLAQLLEEQHKEKIEDLRGVQTDISWGNQIRNYVLQPYQLVKDQRSGHETSNAQRVLDGDLDPFIRAQLRWKKSPAN